MSTTLSVSPISFQVGWNFQKVLTWTNAVNAFNFSWSKSLAQGTGAGNAALIYVAQPTIAASSNLDLDLSGSLTDVFGAVIAFTKVKLLYVELTTTTAASSVYVGGHPTAGVYTFFHSATDSNTDQPAIRVRNGGMLFLGCTDGTGYAVTNSSVDVLRIHNEDGVNVATLNVLVVGE